MGVHYARNVKMYLAEIRIDNILVNLGYYKDPEEASDVYQVARASRVSWYQRKYESILSEEAIKRIK